MSKFSETVKKSLPFLATRLKEPSTWVALAVFFGFFGINGEILDRITNNSASIATVIGLIIAFFLPENKPEVPEDGIL